MLTPYIFENRVSASTKVGRGRPRSPKQVSITNGFLRLSKNLRDSLVKKGHLTKYVKVDYAFEGDSVFLILTFTTSSNNALTVSNINADTANPQISLKSVLKLADLNEDFVEGKYPLDEYDNEDDLPIYYVQID
jgi:hypothetical protein